MNPTLAALVVHDLKNALGALEEQLLALEAHPSTELARQARNNCVELRSRFVGFLLLYGGEGALRAVVSDESPADFLTQQVALAQLNANKQTELGDLTDAPPFWYFDPRLVRLALDAALHNAWRFARSSVQLSVRQENGYLGFLVEDDGPGLGTEDEEEDSATGLGSALCLAVAQAHESKGRAGFTRLENRPEGGARFELWLP